MEFKSTNIKSHCIGKNITSNLICDNHISNIRITKQFPCFTKSVLIQKKRKDFQGYGNKADGGIRKDE